MFETGGTRPGRRAIKKTAIITKTTPEEFDAIWEAASNAGMNRSDYVRTAILEKMARDQKDERS